MCGLHRAENQIKAFGSSIRNLALNIVGLDTAVLPLAAVKAFGSMGDQVAKMAKRTGVSVETLDALGAEVRCQSDRYLHRKPSGPASAECNGASMCGRGSIDSGRRAGLPWTGVQRPQVPRTPKSSSSCSSTA